MARRKADGAGSQAAGGKRLQIKQVRSGIAFSDRQKRVLAGLGLGRLGRTVLREDTPSIRGMCAKIAHLVEVKEVDS